SGSTKRVLSINENTHPVREAYCSGGMMKNEYSRRNFLRRAGGAVSLSWGGLRIFAGPPDSTNNSEFTSLISSSQPFIYGTAFYRPPNPPASERRDMLKAIAQKYEFNIVRIYPAWVYYHPA